MGGFEYGSAPISASPWPDDESHLEGTLDFSADGTRVVLLNTSVALAHDGQPLHRNTLQVLDALTGRQIATLVQQLTGQGDISAPVRVSISPDGTRATTRCNKVDVRTSHGTRIESETMVWDIVTGRLLTSFLLDRTVVTPAICFIRRYACGAGYQDNGD